jgi:hypothetical protein
MKKTKEPEMEGRTRGRGRGVLPVVKRCHGRNRYHHPLRRELIREP